jgi:phosphoglycerate dehydrogenase-like enzyme
MKMINVVVAHGFPDEVTAHIRSAAPNAWLRVYDTHDLSRIPPEVLAEADVLYSAGDLPAPEAAPALQWVQAHSAGVDSLIRHPLFLRAEQAGRPIALTTAAGVHGPNISEYALLMMLAFAHRLHRAFEMKQRRVWSNDRLAFLPSELLGATVGIIGYGGIGREVARRCRAFGMRVLAMRHSERPAPARENSPLQSGVEFVARQDLGGLLSASDYVVLAVPLSPQTYHLIDRDAIARMKADAVLVNISRGDVVDEVALIEALSEKRIGGAALDVFHQEPLPADSPLWRLDNVILTPHIAGITPKYDERAGALFAENLRRYVAGEPLLNRVDFSRGY